MSNDRKVMFGIHGWSGAGKTWLAATLPKPIMVLSTEGGWEDVQEDITHWDGKGKPPKADVVIVDVQTASDLDRLVAFLVRGDHPFESVAFDSLHEYQDQLKTSVLYSSKKVSEAKSRGENLEYDPSEVFDQAAWGRLLNHGVEKMRALRDLTRPGAAKRINVCVVMGTDEEALPARPLLQGGLRKKLLYYFDVFGYLTEKTSDSGPVRILQIRQDEVAQAKCRLHLLKSSDRVQKDTYIVRPNLAEIVAIVNEAKKG